MKIKASSERDYVEKWISLLQNRYGFNRREYEVACEYAYMYRKLEPVRLKLKGEERRLAYDPMEIIRKEEALTGMVKRLGMDFESFRTYTKSLKLKGFFDKGTLAKQFRLTDNTQIIELYIEDGLTE